MDDNIVILLLQQHDDGVNMYVTWHIQIWNKYNDYICTRVQLAIYVVHILLRII